MRATRKRATALIAVVALVLAACGNGDDADTDAADEPADEVEDADDADDADDAEEPDVDDAAVEAFFEGETIELIVPFGAGGGVDFNARFIAEQLSQYIPGNPTIQAINVEGGSGVIGGNQYELQTERDGLTMFISGSGNLIAEQFGVEEVRYSTADWVPVLGVPSGGVAYIREDLGLNEDFSNIDDIEFITAMREPTGVDTLWLLGYELLGLNVNPVFGYGGAGDTRVALEQGESNLDWQSTGAYETNVQPLIDGGDARAFFSAGSRVGDELERHEAHEEVPTIVEVYEEIYGEAPSGETWEAYLAMNTVVLTAQRLLWMHSEDPPEAIQAIQQATIEMINDPAFQAEAVEALGPYTLAAGEDAEAILPQLQLDEAQRGTIQDFLQARYDTAF
ncbi:MAG: hypothetical protein JJT89_16420 [Nitriliruptoraceae bacterium]|nr:hypothetical protein [Nitriliruptoraceae bacterium]